MRAAKVFRIVIIDSRPLTKQPLRFFHKDKIGEIWEGSERAAHLEATRLLLRNFPGLAYEVVEAL